MPEPPLSSSSLSSPEGGFALHPSSDRHRTTGEIADVLKARLLGARTPT
jgi:hypothetical protein